MKAPLTPPSSGASLQEFEIQRIDYAAAEAGGRVGGVQAGFPLWQATWTIGKLGEDKSDEWRSFDAELRGATRRFYACDKRRPYPKAHLGGFARMTRVGGTPFDGSATSWSQAIDSDGDCIVTLHGLPAGLVMSTGDYVGFKWSATDDPVAGLPWCTVARVVRGGGGMADATGTLTLMIEPPIPPAVPGTATAHLDNPQCVMTKITDQSKLNPIDRRGAITGGTVVAIQDLRA